MTKRIIERQLGAKNLRQLIMWLKLKLILM